jgi:hypothetical protein
LFVSISFRAKEIAMQEKKGTVSGGSHASHGGVASGSASASSQMTPLRRGAAIGGPPSPPRYDIFKRKES